MYRERRIALVIPSHNEERLIVPTLDNVPDLIDKVYVVDDGSQDATCQRVEEISRKDDRITLIRHEGNRGVGQAIITGYLRSSEEHYDLTVVIGGDHQMDLSEASKLLDPLIDGTADYTKGNRFMREGNAFEDMPKIRLIGNTIISLMTKIASGYYKIFDVVDGYTAITREAIDLINWKKAWKAYGYPMDFLIRLNAYSLRVRDIPRRAIYLEGERQSQIKGFRYALRVSPMLLRGFFWRLGKKYVLSDFHPLVFLYFLGLVLVPLGLGYGCWLVYLDMVGLRVSPGMAVLDALVLTVGVNSLFFAMLFDMMEGMN